MRSDLVWTPRIQKLSKSHRDPFNKMTDTIIKLSAAFKYGVEEGVAEAMQAGRILTLIREQLEASLSEPDTLSSREEARDLLEALNELVEPNAQQTTAIARYFDELSQAFAQVNGDSAIITPTDVVC